MLAWLSRVVTSSPRKVLIVATLALVISGVLGGDVASRLTVGGFEDPSSDSSQANAVLAEQLGAGFPNIVLLVTATDGDVDAPNVARAGRALTEHLADQPDLTNVMSYWSEGQVPPLRSATGDRALVLGRVDVDEDRLPSRVRELAPRYQTWDGEGALTVQVGGFGQQFSEVSETLDEDLVRAELVALPLTLLMLLLVFGSFAATSLPLGMGILSIAGTLLVLRLTAMVTDVSVFALNLTTALGLGLAIDYSLFMVSRYREELRAGHEPVVAVQRMMATAGRAVAFSALTLAVSLLAMLVFPVAILQSFAYAGTAVALVAGVVSLVVLPAVLVLMGHRVNALTVRSRAVQPPDEGLWHRIATFVLRRPVPVVVGTLALLFLLGSPFLHIRLSQADDRVLPETASSRQVGDVLRNEFAAGEAAALFVVAPDVGGVAPSGVDEYAHRLSLLPDVARVDAVTGTYCGEGSSAQLGCDPGELLLGPETSDRYERYSTETAAYLSVVPSVDAFSREAERLVGDIRDTDAPFPVLVTGRSANLVDTKHALLSRLPLALGLIAAVTFVLLFLLFGSVVVPAKAILLNLLSLSATFGAMVWIFQEGHLGGLLDITATGGLDPVIPILMFCIAFGLSLDYEVFLLARIKEEWDRDGDSHRSVVIGLGRTGRIVSAAAAIIAVVFLSFAITSRVSFVTMFGLGLALAVLLDAFVIRGTLVPAFMRLAGRWNWWSPRWLRRIHDRYGGSHEGEPTATRPGVLK